MLDRDTILKLAREIADIESDHRWRESFEFDDFGVIRFAHAIASLVYEDAAKCCEDEAVTYSDKEGSYQSGKKAGAFACAGSIRQRAGEKKE